MTGDARGEAERIVRQLEDAVAVNATAAAIAQWSSRSQQADMSEHLHATKEASVDRLVAALAAAIEVVEARMDKHSQKDRPIEEAMRRNIEAHEELERALSALRARAGE